MWAWLGPSVLFALSLGACASARDKAAPSASVSAPAGSASVPAPASTFAGTRLFDFVPEIAEIVAVEVRTQKHVPVGVVLSLADRDAGKCGDTTTRAMQFELPDWRSGLEVDLARLRRSDLGASYGDNASNARTWVMKLEATPELSPDSRIHPEIPWAPIGTIRVLAAPRDGAEGKISVRLANGPFRFEKILPVRVCLPLD